MAQSEVLCISSSLLILSYKLSDISSANSRAIVRTHAPFTSNHDINNFSWLFVKLELQYNEIPANFTYSLLILKYKGKFPDFAPLRLSAT